MITLHNINNNILISNLSYSGVHQDKYEKWELYQEINMFLGWNQNKKTVETVLLVTNAIINIWKILVAREIFECGLGVVGLLL